MAVMVVALVGVVAAVAVASEVEGPGMAGEARARVGREDERATPMEATGVADAEGMESVVLVANAAQAPSGRVHEARYAFSGAHDWRGPQEWAQSPPPWGVLRKSMPTGAELLLTAPVALRNGKNGSQREVVVVAESRELRPAHEVQPLRSAAPDDQRHRCAWYVPVLLVCKALPSLVSLRDVPCLWLAFNSYSMFLRARTARAARAMPVRCLRRRAPRFFVTALGQRICTPLQVAPRLRRARVPFRGSRGAVAAD